MAQTTIDGTAQQAKYDSATISGLRARNIGSAMMSGRIDAVSAVDEKGRITVYVGAASGGVWKSVDGASSFRPIFDDQSVQSIGAVTIDPQNHKTIYVGSGEPWTRNSVSIGNGVYKSTDGGENWTNIGLKDTERIAKIIVDPKDSNVVLVCAVGPLWSDSDARGIFKSNDAGKTWRKVLAGPNPSTGCGMISSAPNDAGTLYASLWDFRRQAWTFRSGGPGSGLFKSTDGGEHWTEITGGGMPEKPYGRIAVAVAPGKPNTVYTMIESKKSSLYRSDDGGKTWTKGDASSYMVWRPFYFANLIVDPVNENKVFKVDGPLLLSTDGGKSFGPVSRQAHGDFHDVWIDPSNPNLVITGDDGGLWRSLDGGNRWEHMVNLPISQFYHVSVDNADPYHVYGGLQDNSSWVGDSSYPGGVSNSRWENMYGGDGFWMWEDPSDPDYVYAEAQGGEIGRVNRRTHETRAIKPYPNYGEKKLRCNWNSPIMVSPNDKNTLYFGCQFLFRSTDHGQSWQRISPDLSTNDPEKQKQEESGGVTVDNSAAEMNTTVYAISESPKNAQVIWVGTDDGNVQVTRDGGKSWANVTANVQGVGVKAPITSWVEASPFDDATAFAAFDGHMQGDMTPYAGKTTDSGKTWQLFDLAGSGVRGYAHVIKQDSKAANLLFLGTEFGLWVSIDGGAHWAQYRGSNFPAVAVRDLMVQPRTSDLVLGTHGRGIWIIDDISPWRALTPEIMQKQAEFLPASPAIQYISASGGWPEGANSFNGPQRPQAAAIPYYQRSRHIFGDLKIEVLDAEGKQVDLVSPSKHRGVNRALWSMRLKAPTVPPAATLAGAAGDGPRVLPGTYTVRMTKGDQVYTTKLEVVMDPRAKYTIEERKQQFALVNRLAGMLNHMSWAVASIVGVRDQANAAAAKLPANDRLRKQLEALAASEDAIRGKIVATKEGGAITGEERLREFLAGLYGDVNGYDGRPTDSQVARTDALQHELDDVVKQFNDTTNKQLAAVNRGLAGKKMQPIKVLAEADWQQQQTAGGGGGMHSRAAADKGDQDENDASLDRD
ncbi:MAG: sialidase [Candidatus Koribacter versatilis]|uniref:Sialidase n=1 Tax=Candidatus Korobacter versatilis TaxID=658062 RepID=A0A932A9A8_9BACT|nr:sialidase [Candidatus Koribacter versatilis]